MLISFSSSQFWVYSSTYLLKNISSSEPMNKNVYNSDASETALRSENEIEFTEYVIISHNVTQTKAKGNIVSETIHVLSIIQFVFWTLFYLNLILLKGRRNICAKCYVWCHQRNQSRILRNRVQTVSHRRTNGLNAFEWNRFRTVQNSISDIWTCSKRQKPVITISQKPFVYVTF